MTNNILHYIILIYIGVIILTSCTTGQNNNQPLEVNTINLDNKEYAAFSTKDIFKSGKVIILENDKMLIGSIDKMQAYNGLFIILDKLIAKGVFIFNKEGKFIRRIGNIGIAPDEYTSCSDFTINKNDNSICIYDSYQKKIYKYNINNGKLKTISKINIQNSTDYIHWNDNKLYISHSFRPINEKGTQYILQEVDTTSGKVNKKLFEVKQYNKSWKDEFVHENLFYNIGNNTDLFTYGFMDSIMIVKNGHISPYIALKSKDLIKTEDIEKALDQYSTNDVSTELFRRLYREKKIFNIRNIFKYKDNIYIDYLRGRGHRMKYNIKTKDVTLYDHFQDNLLFAKKIDSDYSQKFLTSDEKGVYYYVSTDYLSEIKHFAETDGILSDDIIGKSKLKSIDINSNPVILYYEFKD